MLRISSVWRIRQIKFQKNKETFTIKIVFRGGLSFPDFSVIIQKDYLYARFPTSISGQSLTKFES